MAANTIFRANSDDIIYAQLGRAFGAVPQSKNLSFDADAVYAQIERRIHKVVVRAGRMALGSAVQRAPVRKVFSGGRQRSPRFYTLAEAKMSLPSFLRTEPRHPATPNTQALSNITRTFAGPVAGKAISGEGQLMSSGEALDQLLHTRIRKDRNKANNWQKTGQRSHNEPGQPADREVGKDDRGYHLLNRSAEYGLTTRGHYELKKGRALSSILGARSAHRHESQQGTERVKQQLDLPSAVGMLGGTLRRSIESADRTTARGPKVSIVAGGDDAPYARFVEFGTRHAAAQPFLRPALKHVEGPYKAMMRDEFPGSR